MKLDFIFGLENAAWPALLVDANGVILKASISAKTIFGKELESGNVNLSSIWSLENEESSLQFLSKLETSTSPFYQIIFTIAGGVHISFPTNVCSFTYERKRFYVLQLLPEVAKSDKPGADKFAESQQPKDTEIILHKQKLDCALQLARTVALDFNNALTSILAHTSLILSKIEPDNPWRKSLLEIEKSAQRAAEIAADLAAFSRQEKQTPTQKTGNINELVRRVVELFKKPDYQNIKWIVNLEKRIYTFNFDEAKIQQALMKIIENSIQAIPQGKQGSISISTRNLELSTPTQDRNVKLPAGCYVCLEITDDGCGIEPENLDRVFEPFFTTKRGHRGLGLTWVYGIVTNHGGNVAISSQPGRGTAVRLYFPATKKIVVDSFTPTEDLYGKETILMVDDEDLILTMAEVVLSSYGYKVLTANNGHRAIEILKENKDKIDLVITDLVMPQMSGRELVEHIQRILPSVKIIYTSGFVRPTADEKHNYLQKPFTSQELLIKVRQVLDAKVDY